MPVLIVTKWVGEEEVGDVGGGRLQPSLRDEIHTDSYPALKRRAIVKRVADDIGFRNDMRSG